MIHTKRIKDLESVPTGVVDFEKLLHEYVGAGGPGYDGDDIWKSDLRRALPQKLREDTTVLNIGAKTSFANYRETVLSQARTLIHFRRQSGGLQGAVGSRPADMPELGGRAHADDQDDQYDLMAVISELKSSNASIGGLCAAVGRFQNRRA